MKMPRPSKETLEAFNRLAGAGPGATVRKMFGQSAAFVHGNMFMGVFGDGINFRLDPASRDAAVAAGAEPFAPMGRPMKEYVVLPASTDPALLERWAALAYTYGASLPAKEPKPRAAPKSKPGVRRRQP